MGMRIGIRHKLPPSSAGASFSSLPKIPDRERCRPPPLLNTTRGKLCQIWPSPDAKLVERYHFYRLQSLIVSLRETHILFEIFDVFDSESHGRDPSTTAYSFDILILSPLAMDHLIRRSHYSQVFYVVAVAYNTVAKS